MSSYDHMIPIKITETIQNIFKIHVAFNNNLDKNWAYTYARLKVLRFTDSQS